jgi:8-oxo-dGTP diphosphatase
MSKPKRPQRRRTRTGANAGQPASRRKPPTKAAGAAPRARHYYDVRQYAILTDEKGHVLILQLPREYDETAANTWTLPGGKLEPTDNPAEGLLREIAEETGLNPTPPVLCGIARWTTRASKKLGVFYRTNVKGTKPELKLSDEHQRAVWVAPSELAGFPFHRAEMLGVLREALGLPV